MGGSGHYRAIEQKIITYLAFAVASAVASITLSQPSLALPPPEDIPEEILRTEIITEARSPLDGKPLTAAEYAELQVELAEAKMPPELSPQVREIIFLLQLRRLLPF